MDPDIAAVGHDQLRVRRLVFPAELARRPQRDLALRLFLEDAVGVVHDLGETALQAVEAAGEGVEALARGTGGAAGSDSGSSRAMAR